MKVQCIACEYIQIDTEVMFDEDDNIELHTSYYCPVTEHQIKCTDKCSQFEVNDNYWK